MDLALRLNWTPEEVERLDPDFVEELIARMNADADIENDNRRKAARKGKRGRSSGGKGGGTWTDEDADIADIT